MTRKSVLALFAAAAVCAGCRSDGGFDRHDSASGMAFATKTVVDRTKDDAATTVRSISSAPHEFVRSFTTARHNMAETWTLYFEGKDAK